MIRISEVCKRFSTVEALKGVSLEVAQKEIVAIVGKSGAGKSTLLQILGTLMPADSGKVEIAGVDISTLAERELAAFRNQHIGFVFSDGLPGIQGFIQGHAAVFDGGGKHCISGKGKSGKSTKGGGQQNFFHRKYSLIRHCFFDKQTDSCKKSGTPGLI
jgi:ABC-type phosphonate transport system ATPase subunit